jgi:hypothetical protein
VILGFSSIKVRISLYSDVIIFKHRKAMDFQMVVPTFSIEQGKFQCRYDLVLIVWQRNARVNQV